MRSTLIDFKNSRAPATLNLSPDDPRLVSLCNEAQQRIVQLGENFWGLYAKYRFCVTNGCITFPRQIAAIESVSVCNRSLTVRNEWFEFLESGSGLQGDGERNRSCGQSQYFDRGGVNVCAFADIIGTNKKIKVYADVTEDASAKILLQGYDENNNWIRTQVGGEWIDGEQVLISTTVQTTVHFFSSLTGVQKPLTNGTVRLYEYDTDLTTQRAIAIYESDETRPSYRRSLISNLPNDVGGDCELKTVTVMARNEFIPVRVDTDWLLVGNIPALKDMCQSVFKSEINLASESAFWEAKAIAALRREVRHYSGHGIVSPIRMQPRNIAGASVPNLI